MYVVPVLLSFPLQYTFLHCYLLHPFPAIAHFLLQYFRTCAYSTAPGAFFLYMSLYTLWTSEGLRVTRFLPSFQVLPEVYADLFSTFIFACATARRSCLQLASVYNAAYCYLPVVFDFVQIKTIGHIYFSYLRMSSFSNVPVVL